MDRGEEVWAVVVAVEGGVERVIGRVTGPPPDLGVVDALARLQLAAQRMGSSIRLRSVGPELCDLLDLAGLADVIPADAEARLECGLTLEAGREAEGDEALGIQKVVPPRDAPP